MLEPIHIDRPEIFQKVRSRLGVRTGVGRSAELDMAIHPMIDVDPLLLESRVHHIIVTVDSVRPVIEHTVPAGEYWHMKNASWESVANADFSLFLTSDRPPTDNPASTQRAPLSDLWAFSGIGVRVQPLNMTLRPGDTLGWESLVWVANGGNSVFTVVYDLEDCSS